MGVRFWRDLSLKTILFFDDWHIHDYSNVTRRWFSAETIPGVGPMVDANLDTSFHRPAVYRDQNTGVWTMWATGSVNYDKGDEGLTVFLYQSDDGYNWKPVPLSPAVDRLGGEKAINAVFSGEYSSHGSVVYYDEREIDPSRRYKVVYSEICGDRWLEAKSNKVATSPDGVHWTIDHDAIWREHPCDTFYYPVFNPYTGKYQFTARSIWGDRRIALYETENWKSFANPRIVVHPDSDDPKCVEFYGMPQFLYEGYFLGLLWRMHGAPDDFDLSLRMKGKVDTELMYSVNGLNWNHTNRKSIIPDGGIGSYGFLNIYPSCIVPDGNGWIRIYANAGIGEHDEAPAKSIEGRGNYLMTYRIRQDGFCAFETISDVGRILFRPMIAKSGAITVNATVTPYGHIRAELRKVPENTPIPGFEMENSVPIVNADDRSIQLRWKDGKGIDRFAGEPFRILLELDQARLYAVRADVDYLYASYPQPDLAGDDYIVPERMPLPWFTHNRAGAYDG